MTDDLLNENTDNTPANPAPASDPNAELLATIKREDGTPKYDSVDKALGALATSQEFIAQLEAENASLREQASKIESMEALLNKMQAQQAPAAAPASEPTSSSPAPSADQIAEIARKTMQSEAAARMQAENRSKFNQQLSATYGEKAKEALQEACAREGVSMDWVRANALTNPDFTIKALGLTQGKVSTTTPHSTLGVPVKSGDPEPNPSEYKNSKEYFSALSAWTARQLS